MLPIQDVSSTVITISHENDTKSNLGRFDTHSVRKSGLERPYSKDQIIACVGHVLSALCFYMACAMVLVHCSSKRSQTIVTVTVVALIIHIPTLVVLFISWISCVSIDPSKSSSETLPNGWFGFRLTGPRWEKARYCAVCRKVVPGLDHHCTWLQTCVGQSNYAQFFTVACTGTLQFLLQGLYASLCLIWLELPLNTTSASIDITQVLLAICLLSSIPSTIMYFILLGFHIYLYLLGYGTYEWMLRRRRAQRARNTKAGDPPVSPSSISINTSQLTDTKNQTQSSLSIGNAKDSRSVDESRQLTAL